MSRYIRPRPAPARRRGAAGSAIPWQHGAEPVPAGRLMRLAIAATALIFLSGFARAAEADVAGTTPPAATIQR